MSKTENINVEMNPQISPQLALQDLILNGIVSALKAGSAAGVTRQLYDLGMKYYHKARDSFNSAVESGKPAPFEIMDVETLDGTTGRVIVTRSAHVSPMFLADGDIAAGTWAMTYTDFLRQYLTGDITEFNPDMPDALDYIKVQKTVPMSLGRLHMWTHGLMINMPRGKMTSDQITKQVHQMVGMATESLMELKDAPFTIVSPNDDGGPGGYMAMTRAGHVSPWSPDVETLQHWLQLYLSFREFFERRTPATVN